MTENNFSIILHDTARLWKQALETRLRKADINLSQSGWLTIAAVAQAKKPLSQTELADHLGIQGASLVPMIDRLIRARLLERKPSETDRRVKFVVLTGDGLEKYREIKAEAQLLREEILSHISKDDLRIAQNVLVKIWHVTGELMK